MIKRKFVQYTLWTDCNNHCKFCANAKNKTLSKIDNLEYYLSIIDKDLEYCTDFGFIGGEFFNKQLVSLKVKDLFYKLIDKVISKLELNQLQRFYISVTLIQKNLKDLIDCLDLFKKSNCIDKVIVCTSYDTAYRFFNSFSENLWKSNMKFLKIKYPVLRLHTEIILTQDFLEKCLSKQFDIFEFKKEFCTDLNFTEPRTGLGYYRSKEEMQKDLPLFFPKRSTFLRFLKEFCIDNSIIDLRTLLSRELLADVLYQIYNNRIYRLGHRHQLSMKDDFIRLNLPYMTQSGYIDSGISMRQDIEQLL